MYVWLVDSLSLFLSCSIFFLLSSSLPRFLSLFISFLLSLSLSLFSPSLPFSSSLLSLSPFFLSVSISLPVFPLFLIYSDSFQSTFSSFPYSLIFSSFHFIIFAFLLPLSLFMWCLCFPFLSSLSVTFFSFYLISFLNLSFPVISFVNDEKNFITSFVNFYWICLTLPSSCFILFHLVSCLFYYPYLPCYLSVRLSDISIGAFIRTGIYLSFQPCIHTFIHTRSYMDIYE